MKITKKIECFKSLFEKSTIKGNFWKSKWVLLLFPSADANLYSDSNQPDVTFLF